MIQWNVLRERPMPSKNRLTAILNWKRQICQWIKTWPAWTECSCSTARATSPTQVSGSQRWTFISKDAWNRTSACLFLASLLAEEKSFYPSFLCLLSATIRIFELSFSLTHTHMHTLLLSLTHTCTLSLSLCLFGPEIYEAVVCNNQSRVGSRFYLPT